MTIKYPENYITIRDMRQSSAILSEEMEDIMRLSKVDNDADLLARLKMLEIKLHLAKANELYHKGQYQNALMEYKIVQGLIYTLLQPSVPKNIGLKPEVSFPVDNSMFLPLLSASMAYIEALSPRNVETAFGPAFTELPENIFETFNLYKNLGVHPTDDYMKKLSTISAGKEIRVQWKSGEALPIEQLVNDIYRQRITYNKLPDIHFDNILPSDFAVSLPHIYFFVIPVSMGDCCHKLGGFNNAETFYLQAANYEYINPNLEAPALWLKLAENVLAWGDQRYKNEDYQTALGIYRKVMEPPGNVPFVWNDSPLYKLPALKPVGDLVRTMLKQSSSSRLNLNPALSLIVLTIKKRLTQLQAGLDFLGLSPNIMPIWSFEYLQNVARYFAQQAIKAERDFINFWDQGEKETLTWKQLQQAVILSDTQVELASRQLEEAQVHQTVSESASIEAHERQSDAFNNYSDYATMSPDRRNIDAAMAGWWQAYSYPDFVREAIYNDTRDREENTDNYELSALSRQYWELLKAEDVAKWQVKEAIAQVDVANQNLSIALMQKQLAQEHLAAFESQFFTPDVWKRMGDFISFISHTYFVMAVSVAKMMELAYNFENDQNLNVIKPDYSVHSVNGMLAGDELLQDIDLFTYNLITTGKQKQIPIKQTISLVDHYPYLFETQFKQTGRMQFETRLEDFDLVFPGTYGRRIVNIEVEVDGNLPPRGIRGTLTNNGVSRYRTSDINKINYRIQPVETLLLSEYRLNLDKQSDVFVFPVDSAKLKTFERAGVEGTWTLEIPKSTNDLDLNDITNIQITFYYNAFYDQKLDEDVRAQLASFAKASKRVRLGEIFYTLSNFKKTGKWKFSLELKRFPHNQLNPQIQKVTMLLLTEQGTDPSGWNIRFSVPGHPNTTVASPNAQGEIVAAVGNPWGALMTGTAIGDYLVEIRADENPNLVENGVLKLDKIHDIIIILEYGYTPRK